MLTSDLRISFRESHYPPLLVSTSSTPALWVCFTMSLKTLRLSHTSPNILNFKALWNAHAAAFYVCDYFRKSMI